MVLNGIIASSFAPAMVVMAARRRVRSFVIGERSRVLGGFNWARTVLSLFMNMSFLRKRMEMWRNCYFEIAESGLC